MQKIKFVVTVVCLSLVLGCQSKNNEPIIVKNLDQKQQEKANDLLRKGILPTPEQVGANTHSDNNTHHENENDQEPGVLSACDSFRKQIPADWFQELLEVPEDPAQPNGIKIKIFYYGKINPNSIPTVFFNGGPDSSSHSSVKPISNSKAFFDLDNKTSFVFIDQRGTGCSDFYPDGQTPESLNRLRLYGSRGIVSDSEQVRNKIYNGKKWNIFGQSYGAFIVHRYVTINPESVHAAFAHANTINSDGFDRLKNRIASQEAMISLYLKQYQEDKAIFDVLKNKLTFDTCFQNIDKNQKICGYLVLEQIVSDLLGFSNKWITIHEWLGLLTTGNEINQKGMAQFLATFYFTPIAVVTSSAPGSASGGSVTAPVTPTVSPVKVKAIAEKVIAWVDRNIPMTDAFTCQKIQAELLKDGVDISAGYSNECLRTLQMQQQSTAPAVDTLIPYKNLVQDILTIPDFSNALQTTGQNISFYLYSGNRDTYVPKENFNEEVSAVGNFKNVFYTNFSGTGHDGFYTEPKVWLDLIKESDEVK